MITAKAVCASTLLPVFEPAQLFRSIDKSSWAGSETSQKSPTQSAFAVSASDTNQTLCTNLEKTPEALN